MNALFAKTIGAVGRALAAMGLMRHLASSGAVHSVLQSPLWARQRWLKLFGWPGIVGAGLLAMCPAFYFSTIKPAQANLVTAQQNALSVHERVKLAANGLARNQAAPAEQLAEFYRIFPNDKNMLPWLEKIFALAHGQGIALDRGEYKVINERTAKLTRFQITFPIKSEYPQIRKFLNSLQAEAPIVSIEHLQFERQKTDTALVEAKIVLALYLEHGP